MPTYRTARELIQAVIARYRSLESYCDTGLVHPVHAPAPVSSWFETRFARPARFRFQFIRPFPHRRWQRLPKYIIGRDGHTAYFYAEYPGAKPVVSEEPDLAMAVAGATGISEGTAHTIASLLFEEVGGFSFLMLKRLRFRRSHRLDGVPCHRVSGRHPCGGRVILWIGVEDLLIRRIVDSRSASVEERYDTRTDVPIAAEAFAVPRPAD